MGFDCTLHLVDERAIRDELVPRILGRGRTHPFEKRKVHAAALASLTKGLATDEPADVARALTALAIQFSAASLPHLAARGVAISLWKRAPRALGASPEALFEDVIRIRTQLSGRFPVRFDENWMTGVYIPAARVAAARGSLNKSLDALPKGDRSWFEPIERVLAAAEAHGLAYWEATDLDVVSAKSTLLAAPAPTGVRGRWKVPRQGVSHIVGRVDDVLCARLGDDSLLTIDLGRVPPAIERLAIDYPTFVDRIGTDWLTVERRKDDRPFRFRLFRHARSLDRAAKDAAPDYPGRALVDVGRAGEHIFGREDAVPPILLRHVGSTFTPVAGIAPAKGRKDEYVIGWARTGDGADVLVWDGNGYEWNGARFTKTFPLSLTTTYGGWTSAPSEGGSFYFALDGHVSRAERGKKATGVATKVRNVQRLAAGPAGSVLFRLGDNKAGWAVALCRDGKAVGLDKTQVTDADDDVHAIEWSERAGCFFVVTSKAVVALPSDAFDGGS